MTSSATTSRRSAGRRPAAGGAIDRWLSRSVDAGMAALVFVAPYFMGGRHPLGQLVLVLLTTWVAAVWLASQWRTPHAAWLNSPAQWLLLAALALVTLQITPLPESWLTRLSPHLHEILPLWTTEGFANVRLGTWATISVTPEETRQGLLLLGTYAVLFSIGTQRIRQLADIERLVRWIAGATAAMALFGLTQYLAGNDKYLWIYRHPFSIPTDAVHGSFSNRNHFAHFMSLGLGPLLWCAHEATQQFRAGFAAANGGRGSRRATLHASLAWGGLGLVLFAALLSYSRGGAVALMAAGAAYAAVGYRGKLLNKRLAASLAGVVLLVGAGLSVHGYRSVAGRLGTLASGSIEELDQHQGRRDVWGAVVQALPDFPWLGAGVGSHTAVYPKYLAEPGLLEYTHAENGYLQIAEETGLAGGMLLLTGLGLCAGWCWSTLRRAASPRHLACLAAVAASLTASAVHSGGDFVWYVPACVVVVCLLAPCAYQLSRLSADGVLPTSGSSATPRFVWPLAALAMLGVGSIATFEQLGPVLAQTHWDRYHLQRRELTDPQAIAELALAELEPVARHNTSDARAHLQLAEAYLRHFDRAQAQAEDAMSLTSIRDAAHSSSFASPEELNAWLSRAIGPRKAWLDRALWHTRRAVTLSPLLGHGYVYLSELAFLEKADAALTAACIQQALTVRPYDGQVLFKAGEEALLAGNVAGAVDYWKTACRIDPQVEAQLVELAASRGMPLAFFVEQFQPQLCACRLLSGRYRAVTPPAEFHAFLLHYLQASEAAADQATGPAAGRLWLESHRLSRELPDAERAWQAVQQALRADPNSLEIHRACGDSLLERQEYAAAEAQFKWCLLRQPGDPALKALVASAIKQRIDSQTQNTSRAAAGNDRIRKY